MILGKANQGGKSAVKRKKKNKKKTLHIMLQASLSISLRASSVEKEQDAMLPCLKLSFLMLEYVSSEGFTLLCPFCLLFFPI